MAIAKNLVLLLRSERFTVTHASTRGEASCLNNNCTFCGGEAATHVYTHIFSDGKCRSHCGTVALEISNIKADDISEIKKLIKEDRKSVV